MDHGQCSHDLYEHYYCMGSYFGLCKKCNNLFVSEILDINLKTFARAKTTIAFVNCVYLLVITLQYRYIIHFWHLIPNKDIGAAVIGLIDEICRHICNFFILNIHAFVPNQLQCDLVLSNSSKFVTFFIEKY